MKNFCISMSWYNDIKDQIKHEITYQYGDEYVEMDVYDEEEFDRISKELGWIEETPTQDNPFPHVMRMDFTLDYGSITKDFIAVFNETKISEEEVKDIIRSDPHQHHPQIIIATPEQWENIFRKES